VSRLISAFSSPHRWPRTVARLALIPVTLAFVGSAQAAAVHAPWLPDGSPNGFYDEHDFSSNDPAEWGIDVPLNHGTPIYAPEAGTIIGYQQWTFNDACGTAWCPGRLLVQLGDHGPIVVFGHVNPLVTSGHVDAGQEIATVAWNSGDCASHVRCDPRDGDHVEFMYDASGQSYNSRNSYLPSASVAPSDGCPNYRWNGGGGSADNPCAVLAGFMHGVFGAADSDRDGIPDGHDQCPLVSGTATHQGCPANSDVDRNGHSDLVAFNGSALKVYGWNGAKAGFGLASRQPFGLLRWAGMGDVDGNGHSDLTVYGGSSLKVYGWNGGSAGFGLVSHQPFGSFKWAGMGDVDGNGHSDLTAYAGSSLKVYGWNGPSAGYGLASRQSFGRIKWAAMGDVDGNGKTDLIVYNGSLLRVYGWNGPSGFGLASQQPFGPIRWAASGDVDGNGHSDLVVYNGSALRVYGWNGSAGFGLVSHQSFGSFKWAGMGDVDGNGHSDLIVDRRSSLRVYGWNGARAGFGLASRQRFGSFRWAGDGSFPSTNGS
jgi:FG-GAP-like repeat